jgi:hypothetical protein
MNAQLQVAAASDPSVEPAPAWPWPITPTGYDCSPTLTAAEQTALDDLGWEVRDWPQRWRDPDQPAWRALHRLVQPLADAKTSLDVPDDDFQRRSATDAVALVLRACATRQTTFWAWDAATWAAILGPSRQAYKTIYPRWADTSARSYMIALAYLFGFADCTGSAPSAVQRRTQGLRPCPRRPHRQPGHLDAAQLGPPIQAGHRQNREPAVPRDPAQPQPAP